MSDAIARGSLAQDPVTGADGAGDESPCEYQPESDAPAGLTDRLFQVLSAA